MTSGNISIARCPHCLEELEEKIDPHKMVCKTHGDIYGWKGIYCFEFESSKK